MRGSYLNLASNLANTLKAVLRRQLFHREVLHQIPSRASEHRDNIEHRLLLPISKVYLPFLQLTPLPELAIALLLIVESWDEAIQLALMPKSIITSPSLARAPTT